MSSASEKPDRAHEAPDHASARADRVNNASDSARKAVGHTNADSSRTRETPDRARTIRRINALLAAALTLFFLGHALLGVASTLADPSTPTSAPTFLIWAFIGIALAHALGCIATSYFMLADTVRPPSNRKKQHLVLKWVTGALLALAAGIHAMGETSAIDLFLLAVLALLTWHALVGCKSLARDLGMPRNAKWPLRIIVGAGAALVAILMATSAL